MHTNSNCYCTSVVIKVPGIQGTGIIWETLTEEEKQDISNKAMQPIRDYIEESKTEVKNREINVTSLAQQVESDKNTTVDAKNEVVNLKNSVENQISSTGQTWVNNVINEGNTQVDTVINVGERQVNNVTEEGNTQIKYLQAIVRGESTLAGISCYETRIEITEDIEEGSLITLPFPMTYLVGRDHLRIIWNGLTLERDISFSEEGTEETNSEVFRILIPLKAGDALTAWTVPLGRGSTDELIERIAALEDALADLSRVVVYRE